MKDVEAKLGRLDRMLAHATHDRPTRALIAGRLRDHARQVIDRRHAAYSFELAAAHIGLITAISAYECEDCQPAVEALRDHLRQFHLAAISEACTAPIVRIAPALPARQ